MDWENLEVLKMTTLELYTKVTGKGFSVDDSGTWCKFPNEQLYIHRLSFFL